MIAGVPVLIATPGDPPAERPAPLWPVVLWMHGFRADALAHAAELERCATHGFVAVGVDAVDHGARSSPLLIERLQRSANGALPVMLEVMEATGRELPAFIDALVADFDVDRDRVSLVGISMGAFLAYRAIAAGLPLRAVVVPSRAEACAACARGDCVGTAELADLVPLAEAVVSRVPSSVALRVLGRAVSR